MHYRSTLRLRRCKLTHTYRERERERKRERKRDAQERVMKWWWKDCKTEQQLLMYSQCIVWSAGAVHWINLSAFDGRERKRERGRERG